MKKKSIMHIESETGDDLVRQINENYDSIFANGGEVENTTILEKNDKFHAFITSTRMV